MSRDVVFIAAAVCAAPACAETTYFASIPDLPIAPGMNEGGDVSWPNFSGPGSDLILAHAHGDATPASVEAFYGQSLSALGWSYEPAPRADGMMFMRGRERLILQIEPRGTGTYLRVRLIVRPASMNAD